jgi:hypothetical protein
LIDLNQLIDERDDKSKTGTFETAVHSEPKHDTLLVRSYLERAKERERPDGDDDKKWQTHRFLLCTREILRFDLKNEPWLNRDNTDPSALVDYSPS